MISLATRNGTPGTLGSIKNFERIYTTKKWSSKRTADTSLALMKSISATAHAPAEGFKAALM